MIMFFLFYKKRKKQGFFQSYPVFNFFHLPTQSDKFLCPQYDAVITWVSVQIQFIQGDNWVFHCTEFCMLSKTSIFVSSDQLSLFLKFSLSPLNGVSNCNGFLLLKSQSGPMCFDNYCPCNNKKGVKTKTGVSIPSFFVLKNLLTIIS